MSHMCLENTWILGISWVQISITVWPTLFRHVCGQSDEWDWNVAQVLELLDCTSLSADCGPQKHPSQTPLKIIVIVFYNPRVPGTLSNWSATLIRIILICSISQAAKISATVIPSPAIYWVSSHTSFISSRTLFRRFSRKRIVFWSSVWPSHLA